MGRKMRARKIAKYGNADMIRLKPKDREDLEWEYGDEVDIDGCEKIEIKKNKLIAVKQ